MALAEALIPWDCSSPHLPLRHLVLRDQQWPAISPPPPHKRLGLRMECCQDLQIYNDLPLLRTATSLSSMYKLAGPVILQLRSGLVLPPPNLVLYVI